MICPLSLEMFLFHDMHMQAVEFVFSKYAVHHPNELPVGNTS